MRFSVLLTVLLLGLMLMLSGCAVTSGISADDDSANTDTKTPYDSIAKQFGDDVLKGDWADAYAMTTTAFQATTTQAQMQKEYDDLFAEFKQADANYNPNTVVVDHGDLPSDESEARDVWRLKTVPPKSTWKAWLFAQIGVGGKDGLDSGIVARVFVVDDNGQNKISHVEFDVAGD